MHDIRTVRADPEAFDEALKRRGLPPKALELETLDAERRRAVTSFETAQHERNRMSQEIGRLKRQSDASGLAERLRALGAWDEEAPDGSDKLSRLKAQAEEKTAALKAAMEALPNTLDPEVPAGRDETANVVLREPTSLPHFNFTPKQHFELGEALGLMDFAAAAKLSGARFTVLKGALARLERALGQWMLTLHTEQHGLTEVSPPLLVNDAAMYGTGQLPKFAEDLFRTTDGRWLIPTAEVPLTNLVAGEILPESALPLRFAALTPCFRSEAGSAGRDTRGMLRQHQFQKVEMVSVTRPEDSAEEHERMTRCAERVLTELGLTWRRVFLCAGDTGFSSARTYDLEVWLPGQGAWREISSCSNCRDFQARRMKARYRSKEELPLASGRGEVLGGNKGRALSGKSVDFLHTLNGSGVAVGRALIAVMETHQQADGSILVPEVLQPWMGGLPRIAAAGG